MKVSELTAYKLKEVVDNIMSENDIFNAIVKAYVIGHEDGKKQMATEIHEIMNKPRPEYD